MDIRLISHVRQLDAHGCIVASLAMVSGRTYDQVRTDFPDLDDRDGLDFRHTEDWLFKNGYAWQVVYKYHPPGNSERDPWPIAPWAEVHMCEVTMPSGNSHSVVMLADGTVLDPLTDQPTRLSDYERVGHIRAIYPVTPRKDEIT